MDEAIALTRLPEVYATALRLRSEGLDEEGIASRLGLEREAVGPLLRLAEAKLEALVSSDEPDVGLDGAYREILPEPDDDRD